MSVRYFPTLGNVAKAEKHLTTVSRQKFEARKNVLRREKENLVEKFAKNFGT